jgi:hypothetical protein
MSDHITGKHGRGDTKIPLLFFGQLRSRNKCYQEGYNKSCNKGYSLSVYAFSVTQSISLRLSLPMATHPLTANYSLRS